MCSGEFKNAQGRAAEETTDNTPKDTASFFKLYIDEFFTGEALSTMLTYMCNACTIEVIDPVCSTLHMFLTVPVVFNVTNVGLLPFRNMAMAVYPFSKMSVSQRTTLLAYVRFLKQHSLGTISTQMGGGCVLGLSKAVYETHCLDNMYTLSTFFTMVLENTSYQPQQARVNICNIVLQRLGVSVGISRDTLQQLHQNVLYPFIQSNAGTCTVDVLV